MGNLNDDVAAAVAAVQAVEADVSSAEPTFADKVLEAVQAVFEAEGWTAPAAPAEPAPADATNPPDQPTQ